MNMNILQASMCINGQQRNVVIDTGASVSMVNGYLVNKENIVNGKMAQVRCYDGTSIELCLWTKVLCSSKDDQWKWISSLFTAPNSAFLSCPTMKQLEINISWKDKVTTNRGNGQSCMFEQQLFRLSKDAESVQILYPELICIEKYPPAATTISIPIELPDTTVVWKKPYSMCHEKKAWFKKELQKMLNIRIIEKAKDVDCLIILMVIPKEDGTYRLCTGYRLVNQQTDLFPFSMTRIDDIINETRGCKCFSRIDLCKGYWQVLL